MIVVVDTSVLSVAFRRRKSAAWSPDETRLVGVVKRLALNQRAVLTGMVRQELLSGIRNPKQFDGLRDVLDGFVYVQPDQADHDLAAGYFNQCCAKGVAAGDVDMLLCAIANRRNGLVLTVDRDFNHYARCFPLSLYDPDS